LRHGTAFAFQLTELQATDTAHPFGVSWDTFGTVLEKSGENRQHTATRKLLKTVLYGVVGCCNLLKIHDCQSLIHY